MRPFAKASRELATVQPTRVGKTQGRGKLDVKNEYALPVKDARPLRRDEGSQSQTITRVANAYAHQQFPLRLEPFEKYRV